jgi:molecular chaperone Hsp33
MSGETDSVLRAITNDGAFRVIVARTTETVRGAIAAQHGIGQTARWFGDLLTGSVLFRETMAPRLRVQGIVRSIGGGGSLVADSHPSGKTRGLIQLPKGQQEIDVSLGALLQVMRSLPSGRLNQGIVQMPTGGGISAALMEYMQISEQVVSMISVGTLISDNGVECAGGYLVQLLPEVGRGPLMVMTERLEEFKDVSPILRDKSFSPAWLLEQLLYGMEYTRLHESRVGFDCWCDELRLMGALATLGKNDIEHLLEGGEVLEIRCEYCGKEYRVPPARLRGLLDAS